LLDPIAAAHPALKIVVAHGGGMILAAEAGQLAERHLNVFLECSWLGGFIIRQWVHSLGAHRVLFGSDHAENAPVELAKLRSLNFESSQLNWILYGTAAAVFGIGR
jgi:predicted TIM-barrel fold metal-dependent hydrolase